MAKGTKMNIEVRNIILDLKRLGEKNGQISQTLSEVYGYSVTRFGTNLFEEHTLVAKIRNREDGNLLMATERC